jgi:hypothetical protein
VGCCLSLDEPLHGVLENAPQDVSVGARRLGVVQTSHELRSRQALPSVTWGRFGRFGGWTDLAPESENAAQWLADLHEDLLLIRYPTRVEMLRAVGEAARRAESLARLEYALQGLRLP